jgi:hypothetical protein
MEVKKEGLIQRNYFVVIDRSGSMSEPAKKGGISRWEAVQEYTLAIARECEKIDEDGIDVYLFNKSFSSHFNTTADKVKDLFTSNTPNGGTDFVPVLKAVFDRHFLQDKPSTVVVVTDGEPSDGEAGQKALIKLLKETAGKLESDSELGITFIQVGDDKAASAFLKKLDDDLVAEGAKWDIVDTKTCDELESLSITDVLLAAIND